MLGPGMGTLARLCRRGPPIGDCVARLSAPFDGSRGRLAPERSTEFPTGDRRPPARRRENFQEN